MSKYVCSICGYIYDEAAGIPDESIAPGTKWDDVPSDWVCPLCGAVKDAFNMEAAKEKTIAPTAPINNDDDGELSFGQLSALFSNIARSSESNTTKRKVSC